MLGQGKHQVPGAAECAPLATVPYTCKGNMAPFSANMDIGHETGQKHAVPVKTGALR